MKWLLAAAVVVMSVAAQAAPTTAAVVMIVGERRLEARDFEEALQIVVRQRYFHGNVPADAWPGLREEARLALIDRVLQLEEARRRGIKPDLRAADAALAAFEPRLRGAKDAGARRARLRQRLIEDGLIDALQLAEKRAVPAPTATQLRAFFDSRRDLFTEPATQRVAVILLGVEASAPAAKWAGARAEAADVVARLARGADFAATARLRSTDASAAAGGDMGYLHRGMLPEPAQAAIDRLAPGAVTQPITLLSGVAIFRLIERRPSRPRAFEDVRERVAELWVREEEQRRAAALMQRLRTTTKIRVADAGPPRGQ